MNRRSLPLTLALLGSLALGGCDDVLLFDVTPSGRLIAAIDGDGAVACVGDGARRRHLALIDPIGGTVERLTTTPLSLSWPRRCGDAVALIEDQERLVLLRPDGSRRVLFETDRRLVQPTPTPAGDRIAVLEVEQLGLPGLLHVVDVETGATGVPIDGAVLGFAWTRGDGLLVPRLAAGARADARPFAGGEGEVLLVRGHESRQVFSGPLGGLTWLASAPGGAVVVLPHDGDPARLHLSRLTPARSGGAVVTAGERTEGCDLWPTVGPDGRVLFTRSRPGEGPGGELRLSRSDALGASIQVPTPGLVSAPRWVSAELVAYLTADGHLVTQDLQGHGLVDWTEQLRTLTGDLP